MIEALFNNTGYVAAKKSLDVVALRQEAIARNIANLETPGYKRVDVAPSFQAEFAKACAAGNVEQMASLKPQLVADASAVPNSKDGNTVNLENELFQLNQNSIAHSLQTQLVTGRLLRLKLAISGKS